MVLKSRRATHAPITRALAEKVALVLVLGPNVKSAKPAQEKGELIWSIDIVTPLTKKVASVSMFGSTALVRNWSQYHLIGV